jgi:hypothetical protein
MVEDGEKQFWKITNFLAQFSLRAHIGSTPKILNTLSHYPRFSPYRQNCDRHKSCSR